MCNLTLINILLGNIFYAEGPENNKISIRLFFSIYALGGSLGALRFSFFLKTEFQICIDYINVSLVF